MGGASLKGESGNRDAALPLHTTLVGANGTTWEWKAGSPITLPLSSLLLAAHHQICNQGSAADLRDGRADGACRTGIRLDEPNVDLQPDVANASRYPAFRTSGVSLSLEISYTNANDEKLAELNRKSVRATVKASVQTGAFSSVGGSTTFSTYPSGSIGAETWELASRYKQGIMVHLTSSDVIYTFDPFYFVNVMVAGLVLLGLASTVADFFAFWCLGGGQSTVLRNKRCEKVSKRSEFAETGLKAVIAAQQFKLLDPDGNGVVEAIDLVHALAGVEAAEGSGPFITPHQAHAIATAIMCDADVDDPTASMSNSKSVGSLDFAEFMTCLDGDGGSFQFFLKKLKKQESSSADLLTCFYLLTHHFPHSRVLTLTCLLAMHASAGSTTPYAGGYGRPTLQSVRRGLQQGTRADRDHSRPQAAALRPALPGHGFGHGCSDAAADGCSNGARRAAARPQLDHGEEGIGR